MKLRQRPRDESRSELIEIITPRTNTAIITPAENLFAAIAFPETFSPEIASTRTARWFLAHSERPSMREHLEAQLAAAYPRQSYVASTSPDLSNSIPPGSARVSRYGRAR